MKLTDTERLVRPGEPTFEIIKGICQRSMHDRGARADRTLQFPDGTIDVDSRAMRVVRAAISANVSVTLWCDIVDEMANGRWSLRPHPQPLDYVPEEKRESVRKTDLNNVTESSRSAAEADHGGIADKAVRELWVRQQRYAGRVQRIQCNALAQWFDGLDVIFDDLLRRHFFGERSTYEHLVPYMRELLRSFAEYRAENSENSWKRLEVNDLGSVEYGILKENIDFAVAALVTWVSAGVHRTPKATDKSIVDFRGSVVDAIPFARPLSMMAGDAPHKQVYPEEGKYFRFTESVVFRNRLTVEWSGDLVRRNAGAGICPAPNPVLPVLDHHRRTIARLKQAVLNRGGSSVFGRNLASPRISSGDLVQSVVHLVMTDLPVQVARSMPGLENFANPTVGYTGKNSKTPCIDFDFGNGEFGFDPTQLSPNVATLPPMYAGLALH